MDAPPRTTPSPPPPRTAPSPTAGPAAREDAAADLPARVQRELDDVLAHQRDLLAGLPAVRDESARLQAVRDVCRAVADRLRGAVIDAERTVAELRRKGDPPVDELVCSTSIVHNQCVASALAVHLFLVAPFPLCFILFYFYRVLI